MVLMQLEQHAQAHLLGVAPFLIGSSGSYILTEQGARIRLSSGYEFNFPVLTGQGPCEVIGPCLVAYANEATQQEGFTLNHNATLAIELRWPADAESNLGTREELLACFQYAAGQLQIALYRHDLAKLLTESITGDEFTCFFVMPDPVQESLFDAAARLRLYRMRLTCIVASDLIPEEEPAPLP